MLIGIATAVGLVLIVAKFDKRLLKKMLGYDWAVDIVVTLGLPLLFIGTYSAMVSGVITGLCMSAILYVAKKTMGYEKYEKVVDGKRGWVSYEGKWTIRSVAYSISHSIKTDISESLNEFKRGWNDEKLNAPA